MIARLAGMVSSSSLSIVRKNLRYRQLRQDSFDWIVQPEPALLKVNHGADRCDQLGHRGQAEDRIALHRRRAVEPEGADSVDVVDLTPLKMRLAGINAQLLEADRPRGRLFRAAVVASLSWNAAAYCRICSSKPWAADESPWPCRLHI